MIIQNVKNTLVIAVWFVCILLNSFESVVAQYYEDSYALVIGIDKYASSQHSLLKNAKKDAQSIANVLKKRGFEVVSLYNEKATRNEIIRQIDSLARKLTNDDRVLIFFAGHGYTEIIGNEEFGYIVPYDGIMPANYISMDAIREQSRKMVNAKHQLFIMDSCFGGLLGTRDAPLPEDIPNYIKEVTSRRARQVLMAGGKDQVVADDGPGGHSIFTAALLDALKQGHADTNGDGFIVFPELFNYVFQSAWNHYQTPASSHLPGHGLGEFVFLSQVEAPRKPALSPNESVDDPEKTRTSPVSPSQYPFESSEQFDERIVDAVAPNGDGGVCGPYYVRYQGGPKDFTDPNFLC
jgi:hypothetical protein